MGRFAAGAAASLFFCNFALFGFAHARVGERMGAGTPFFLGQRAEHDTRRFWLGGGFGLRRVAPGGRRRSYLARRLLWFSSGRGLRLGLAADYAPFDLLDHDLLAAAMAETLAHRSRFGTRLERQRLAGDAKFFLARGLCLAHSVLCPYAPSVGACALTASGEKPVRNRVRRATRARNVSLPGPASRAACTTFGRLNAKSNWSPVNVSMMAISPAFPVVLRRKAAASLRFPSAAASAAWTSARMLSRPSVPSTFERPQTIAPALPAIANASSAARSRSLSV